VDKTFLKQKCFSIYNQIKKN